MVDWLSHPQIDGLLTHSDSLAYGATPLGTSLESATFAPSNNQRSDLLDRSDLAVLYENKDGVPEQLLYLITRPT